MCEHIKIGGADVIVCGLPRPRYCACGRAADYLCDWKISARKSGTCDAPICAAHSKQVAPGKNLCPEHQRHYDDWKKRHPPAQGSLFEKAA